MKTLQEIINQQPVFLNDWKEDGINGLITDFEISKLPVPNVLFGSYSYENYSGDAWVLVEENGKLFEVNGSHCSCYGLEQQWEKEEVCLPELEQRIVKGTFGTDSYCSNEFKNELLTFLGI